ncbi:MAG: cupin [Pelomonas sp.]|nr:cupin [Roseateles sp.]
MLTVASATSRASQTAQAGVEQDARYYEYSKAANPIGARLITRVPYRSFLPDLYASGPTRVVTLDLSHALATDWPATGPGLCAHFLRILPGESLSLDPNATSMVLYVIKGAGQVLQGAARFNFSAGGFITMPGGSAVELSASAETAIYCVDDEPLLRYLGATVAAARFRPTYYPPEAAQAELSRAAADPNAGKRSRISVLLGNKHFPQTRTATQTLWAMYGLLPGHSVQKPHRHQSIALDFIVKAAAGCYTLVGPELDADGNIASPQRVDWVSGMAFVTPPGYWHAHYNDTDELALLIPVQDAGLQTYLRALDIRFQY